MSKILNKKKQFKHSTTFYRRVKQQINPIGNASSVNAINLVSNEILKYKSIDHDFQCSGQIANLSCSTEEEIDDDVNSVNETEYDNQVSLQIKLRVWAITFNVPHATINGLLNILNDQPHINLPIDSRTLLHTPKSVNIVPMGRGQFWYNGIKAILECIYHDLREPISIGLIFNMDGIPPFKSYGIELWPILVKISERQDINPQVVAIYCGKGKPPLEEYLTLFVDELSELVENGIIVNKKKNLYYNKIFCL